MNQLVASLPSSQYGGDGCLVRHNPSFTDCRKTGNIWFDSPLFEEVGCYTSGEFEAKFGYEKVDLDFYRRIGGFCMRYKRKDYPLKIEVGAASENVTISWFV